MLTLMLVLAVPCCFIEYKLTESRPQVRLWLAQHKIAALAWSTAISVVFGIIFGAEGLIIFGAGMISTMIMICVYSLQPTIEANKDALKVAGKTVRLVFGIMVFTILAPFKLIATIQKRMNK